MKTSEARLVLQVEYEAEQITSHDPDKHTQIRFGMKDHELREFVNELTSLAREYAGHQQLRERIGQCVKTRVGQTPEVGPWQLTEYEDRTYRLVSSDGAVLHVSLPQTVPSWSYISTLIENLNARCGPETQWDNALTEQMVQLATTPGESRAFKSGAQWSRRYTKAVGNIREYKQTVMAILVREIGNDSFFDHRPVRPGSEEHERIKNDPNMDYVPVYAILNPQQPQVSPESLREFSSDQWWVNELQQLTENGTDDQKRAMAVVRHLLRAIHYDNTGVANAVRDI